MTTEEMMRKMLTQIEGIAITVQALESASLSPKYAGRQLTPEQLVDLKEQARVGLVKVFDPLCKALGHAEK